jgi:hypothetical protein
MLYFPNPQRSRTVLDICSSFWHRTSFLLARVCGKNCSLGAVCCLGQKSFSTQKEINKLEELLCLHYKDFLGLTFLFDLCHKWKLQLISETIERK